MSKQTENLKLHLYDTNDKFNITAEDNSLNNNMELIDAAISSKAGKKTTEGGEIFNDYENSKATGEYSHAEGYYTEATGYCAHTEGCGTDATNGSAHAEGFKTKAYGAQSHTEGYMTKTGSVDEEGNLVDDGGSAHAEGYETSALGTASHSEGIATVAIGNSSHSEGYNTKATGIGAHAEGGNEYRGTEAMGNASHSEGLATVAEGVAAHAEGDSTNAKGNASHTEGTSTVADADSAHAEGYGSQATKSWAHAEGKTTTASGTASHSEGQDTKATGDFAHAEGYTNTASGFGAHAEGGMWDDSNSKAIGNTASGTASHAEGINTSAQGGASHTEGKNTTATATGAHAEGIGADATNAAAHAEGTNTTASGNSSHSEGQETVASGGNSHAEGYSTKATGWSSHASGNSTIAGYEAQTVVGKYNSNEESRLFEVGNGTSNNDRRNAFEVYRDGHAEVQKMGETDQSVATRKFVLENAVSGSIESNDTFKHLIEMNNFDARCNILINQTNISTLEAGAVYEVVCVEENLREDSSLTVSDYTKNSSDLIIYCEAQPGRDMGYASLNLGYPGTTGGTWYDYIFQWNRDNGNGYIRLPNDVTSISLYFGGVPYNYSGIENVKVYKITKTHNFEARNDSAYTTLQIDGEQGGVNKIFFIENPNQVISDYSNSNLNDIISNLNKTITNISSGLAREVVSELPAVGNEGVLYMVKNDTNEEQNIYDEYLYINGKYELIGSTAVDLSDYVTEDVFVNSLKNKADKEDILYVEGLFTDLEGRALKKDELATTLNLENSAAIITFDDYVVSNVVSGTHHEIHGSANTVSGSDNKVFGFQNNITNGLGNEVFGNSNTIEEGVSFSSVTGFDNTIKAGATKVAVRGQDITVGAGNPADSIGINFFDGAGHTIGDGYGAGNTVAGRGNKTEGFIKSLHMGGQDNTAISKDNYDFNAAYINGYKNKVTNSKYALVTGDNNELIGGQSTMVHGARNHVEGASHMVLSSDTYVGGTGNKVITRTGRVFGNSNVAIGNWLNIGLNDNTTQYQTVLGTYNIERPDDVSFIIGNGTSDENRHNIIEVAPDDNLMVNGTLSVSDTVVSRSIVAGNIEMDLDYNPTGDNQVATVGYVNSKAGGNGSGNTFGIELNAKNDQQVVLGSYNADSNDSLVIGAGVMHEDYGEIRLNALESGFTMDNGGGLKTKIDANTLNLVGGSGGINLTNEYGDIKLKTDTLILSPAGIFPGYIFDETTGQIKEEYNRVEIIAPHIDFNGKTVVRTDDGFEFEDFSNNTLIRGLKAPEKDNDAANKAYVDEATSWTNNIEEAGYSETVVNCIYKGSPDLSAGQYTVTSIGPAPEEMELENAYHLILNNSITMFVVCNDGSIANISAESVIEIDRDLTPSGDINDELVLRVVGGRTNKIYRIKNIANPIDSLDAVNKKYVDSLIGSGGSGGMDPRYGTISEDSSGDYILTVGINEMDENYDYISKSYTIAHAANSGGDANITFDESGLELWGTNKLQIKADSTIEILNYQSPNFDAVKIGSADAPYYIGALGIGKNNGPTRMTIEDQNIRLTTGVGGSIGIKTSVDTTNMADAEIALDTTANATYIQTKELVLFRPYHTISEGNTEMLVRSGSGPIRITDLAEPKNDNDAATKAYVDAAIAAALNK